MINTRWGKIRAQEDYEDTERAAAFDAYRDLQATYREPPTRRDRTKIPAS